MTTMKTHSNLPQQERRTFSRLFAFLQFVTVAAVLASCTLLDNDLRDLPPVQGYGDSVTVKNDSMEMSYQYNDETIYLTDEYQNYVMNTVLDTVVIFQSNIPEDLLPGIGRIITCGQTEKFPYGFGGMVKRVEKNADGNIEVTCVQASLKQIFKHFRLQGKADIIAVDTTAAGMKPATRAGETEYKSGEKVPFSFDLMEPLGKAIGTGITLANNVKGRGGGVVYLTFAMQGQLLFESGIYMDVDSETDKYDIYMTSKLVKDLTISITGQLGAKISLWKNPQNLLKSCIIAIPTPAFGAPIIIRPRLDIDLYLQGDITGTAELHIYKVNEQRYGMRRVDKKSDYEAYHDKRSKGVSSDGTKKTYMKLPTEYMTSRGKGILKPTVKLGLEVRLGLGFYTDDVTAGVACDVTAGFSAEVNTDQKKMNESKVAFDVNIGLSVYAGSAFLEKLGFDAVKVAIPGLSWNPIHTEWSMLPTVDAKSLTYRATPGATALEEASVTCSYKVENEGIFSQFRETYPGIRVTDTKGNEVYTQWSIVDGIKSGERYEYTFKETKANLDPTKSYKLVPVIKMDNDDVYEFPGKGFNLKNEPVMEIWKAENWMSEDNDGAGYSFGGKHYNYRYRINLTVSANGATLCKAWGVSALGVKQEHVVDHADGVYEFEFSLYDDDDYTLRGFKTYFELGPEFNNITSFGDEKWVDCEYPWVGYRAQQDEWWGDDSVVNWDDDTWEGFDFSDDSEEAQWWKDAYENYGKEEDDDYDGGDDEDDDYDPDFDFSDGSFSKPNVTSSGPSFNRDDVRRRIHAKAVAKMKTMTVAQRRAYIQEQIDKLQRARIAKVSRTNAKARKANAARRSSDSKKEPLLILERVTRLGDNASVSVKATPEK